MVRSPSKAGGGALSGGSESVGRGASTAATGGALCGALSWAASLLASHATPARAKAITKIHEADFPPAIDLAPNLDLRTRDLPKLMTPASLSDFVAAPRAAWDAPATPLRC